MALQIVRERVQGLKRAGQFLHGTVDVRLHWRILSKRRLRRVERFLGRGQRRSRLRNDFRIDLIEQAIGDFGRHQLALSGRCDRLLTQALIGL